MYSEWIRCKTLRVNNEDEFYFSPHSKICRVTQSCLFLYQLTFLLLLEIDTVFAMRCENLLLD